MVLRLISTLLGSIIARSGICVMICKVFKRLHIRFIEAPKATAITKLPTIPVVSELSNNEKALYIRRMSAKQLDRLAYLYSRIMEGYLEILSSFSTANHHRLYFFVSEKRSILV